MSVIIDNNIINILTRNNADKTIDNKYYKFIGKGGDGVIYEHNGKIIKIYKKINIDAIIKEFYIVGLLQEINQINKNIISVNKYYLSLDNPVMIMERMDGDLSEWSDMMVKNKHGLTMNEIDINWLSMIFQTAYGLTYLNNLGILHSDAKSKNILYKKNDDKTNEKYIINNKTYVVPTNYIFKIADFGAIQMANSLLHTDKDHEIIKKKIVARADLMELSKIIFRILVNYAKNDYDINGLVSLTKNNHKYNRYYIDNKNEINAKMKHFPQKIKDNMLLRSLIYYAIENDIIDKQKIINKYSLTLPSEYVIDVLDKLTDLNYDVFELFHQFVI